VKFTELSSSVAERDALLQLVLLRWSFAKLAQET
jgi:hypothetical protein